MNNVIIIGAGGHAAEIDEYIRYSQKVTGNQNYKIVGFLDDNPASYARYKFEAPHIGGVRDHKVIKGGYYIMGIANINYRRIFVERFKAEESDFISFIHCNAYISPSAIIGEGTIIGPNANIGPNVRIGKFNLINSRCSLGHDTSMGSFNVISPNVCFSGFTEIGDENFFGINSTTLPSIRIGNRNKIAAGMVVDMNIENDSVVFYRFKEKIIAIPKRH